MALFFVTLVAGILGVAPDFCLPDLAGTRVCLEELRARGPVVLDFWSTTCAPCIKLLPHLEALSKEFEGKATVVGICEDTPKTVSRVPQFVRGRRLTFPILLDTDNSVMRKYKVSDLPYTCIVDTAGMVVYSHMKYTPGDERALRQKLLELTGQSGQEPGAGGGE